MWLAERNLALSEDETKRVGPEVLDKHLFPNMEADDDQKAVQYENRHARHQPGVVQNIAEGFNCNDEIEINV